LGAGVVEGLRERLGKLGVDLDDQTWKQLGSKTIEPPFSKDMRVLLLKIRELLVAQQSQHLDEVKRLREEVNRMRFGGGKNGGS
jgi:hypothetical protein